MDVSFSLQRPCPCLPIPADLTLGELVDRYLHQLDPGLTQVLARITGLPAAGSTDQIGSISCILVVETRETSPEPELIGIITAVDLAWAIGKCTDWRNWPAQRIITPDPIMIQVDQLLSQEQMIAFMREHHLHHLPVVSASRQPLGVLNLNELLWQANQHLQAANAHFCQDAANRRLLEQRMKTYSSKMQAVLESIGELVLAIDPVGPNIEIMPTQFVHNLNNHLNNDLNSDLHGEILNQTVELLSDQAELLEPVIQAIASQTTQEIEYALASSQGQQWFRSLISPMATGGAVWVARNITAAKQAEQDLIQTQQALEQSIGELHRRNQALDALRRLSSQLQTCWTETEFVTVLTSQVERVLGNCSGQVWLGTQPDRRLATAGTWGLDHTNQDESTIEACWVLHCRQAHDVSSTADPTRICHHLSYSSPEHHYLCLPIATHQQSLGVLTISWPIASLDLRPLNEGLVLLANLLAEQVALALTDLHLRQSLKDASIRDPLTQLYNRRYLSEFMDRELALAERHAQPLAILALDIDHFKQFNDRFGHPAGDFVLKSLANLLRDQTRSSDIGFRLGGEEFLMVLLGSALEPAQRRAEEIRHQVTQLRLEFEGQDLGPISTSIGLAMFPSHGQDLSVLLEKADQALYAAKHAGRNCVALPTVAVSTPADHAAMF